MSCEIIVDYILSTKKFVIDNDLNGVKIYIDVIPMRVTTGAERLSIIKHKKIKPSIAYVSAVLLHNDPNDIVITQAWDSGDVFHEMRKLTVVL